MYINSFGNNLLLSHVGQCDAIDLSNDRYGEITREWLLWLFGVRVFGVNKNWELLNRSQHL